MNRKYDFVGTRKMCTQNVNTKSLTVGVEGDKVCLQ